MSSVELVITESVVELVTSESAVILEIDGPSISITDGTLEELGYTDSDDFQTLAAALTSFTADTSTTHFYADDGKGGTLYLAEGSHTITSMLELSRFQNVIGPGKDRCKLLLGADSMTGLLVSRNLSNTAASNDYKNNRRSRLAGFTIDGQSHSGTTGLHLGRGSQWVLEDVGVQNCTTGILCEETQNVTFIDVSAQLNDTNLVLDRGCGGLTFINCEFGNATTGYNLHVKGTTGYDSATALAGDNPCTQIAFYNCRIEYQGSASALGMLYIAAGKRFVFDQCIFANGDVDHTMNFVTVAKDTSMVTDHIDFRDCFWSGAVGGGSFTTTAFLTSGAVNVEFTGKTVMVNFDVGINRGANGTISVERLVTSGVTSDFAGTGSQNTVLMRRFSHGLAPSGQANAMLYAGSNSPELQVVGGIGAIYMRNNGAAGTAAYIKKSGSSSSGWGALASAVTSAAVLDFGSIAAGATSELTATVTGAAAGDGIIVNPRAGFEAGLVVMGYVSAASTVTVRVANVTTGAIDPASQTYDIIWMDVT